MLFGGSYTIYQDWYRLGMIRDESDRDFQKPKDNWLFIFLAYFFGTTFLFALILRRPKKVLYKEPATVGYFSWRGLIAVGLVVVTCILCFLVNLLVVRDIEHISTRKFLSKHPSSAFLDWIRFFKNYFRPHDFVSNFVILYKIGFGQGFWAFLLFCDARYGKGMMSSPFFLVLFVLLIISQMVLLWSGPNVITCGLNMNCDNESMFDYFGTCFYGPQIKYKDVKFAIGSVWASLPEDGFISSFPHPSNGCFSDVYLHNVLPFWSRFTATMLILFQFVSGYFIAANWWRVCKRRRKPSTQGSWEGPHVSDVHLWINLNFND